MRRFLLILLCIGLPVWVQAQDRRIVVRNFDVDLVDMRAKTNPVYDNNGNPAAMISISFAASDSVSFESSTMIGEPQHNPGEWIVYMSAGTRSMDILVPGCETLHFVFPDNRPLVPAQVYTLSLGVEVLNPVRTLVMPSFSYNKSQLSYGLMLGIGKKNGGYVHAKTDFNFGLNPEISCDPDGNVGGVKGWFSGESQKMRYAFTAGYMRQLAQPLYLFVGGGYGSRVLAWQVYRNDGDYQYARVEPNSFTGYEAELGLILRFGGFALSAGVQTNQFKYYEANVGIGVMF